MSKRALRTTGSIFLTLFIFVVVWRDGMTTASAQPATPVATTTEPLLNSLQWDSILKEQTPEPGQLTADFAFKVSNPLDTSVQIERVQTSCGCTVAKLPSTPWVLAPHTNGIISVSVNLTGKSGTFFKTITVYSTNAQKVLTIKLTLPENPLMVRARNQQMAMADAQLVFRGNCATCHVTPTTGLMGKPLYVKACGICHEANPRATMVPDLAHLNHPTDYTFWKLVITDGKPKTLMPAFGAQHGGPLTDDQIESLAKVLSTSFPSSLTPQPLKTSSIQPANGGTAVANR
jgi:mono/diheme cytochrome c family protein